MINKEHSDYKKYKKEFFDLRDKMNNEINKIEEPEVKGLDGTTAVIHKKYAKRIMELQKKYKHLFIN